MCPCGCSAESSGAHLIETFDTYQLQPVGESSGMCVGRDNADRKVILGQAFPTYFHVFARKRDITVGEQVKKDDGALLYLLSAGDDIHQAQSRATTIFYGFRHLTAPLSFIWRKPETMSRFYGFRGLLGCGDWEAFEKKPS